MDTPADIAVKRCPDCDTTKPLSEFPLRHKGGSEVGAYCHVCNRRRRRASYAKAGGKDTAYTQTLKRDYGMTLDDYEQLLRRQARRCAVCDQPETVLTPKTGEPRRLAVDYDPIAKTVRGLVCRACSLLLWAMRDNPNILTALAAYLRRYRERLANHEGHRHDQP